MNHQAFSRFYSFPFISAAADWLGNDRIYSIQHLTWASHIHLGDVRHGASCANAFNKSPLRNGQVCVGDEQADVWAWDMPAVETRVLLMPSQTKLQILRDKSSCVSRRCLRTPGVLDVVRLGRLRRPMPLPISRSAPTKSTCISQKCWIFQTDGIWRYFFFFLSSYASDFSFKKFQSQTERTL